MLLLEHYYFFLLCGALPLLSLALPNSSPSLPLVSLTSPDGGSALGVAALAAAADNAARAMGQQDLGQSTTDGKFLHFPPRASN